MGIPARSQGLRGFLEDYDTDGDGQYDETDIVDTLPAKAPAKKPSGGYVSPKSSPAPSHVVVSSGVSPAVIAGIAVLGTVATGIAIARYRKSKRGAS